MNDVKKTAELIEDAFREGWRLGEEEGRAYGFTGKLATSSEEAWRMSKAKKKAVSLRKST